uniref:Uncharacterized protein n=1 Tax=Strigamia maritima TaxID=126957 RepID=T1J1G0_STRMM
MNHLLLLLLLTLTQLVQCLPFPFELGGDSEDDESYYPRHPSPPQWRFYQPEPRSMMPRSRTVDYDDEAPMRPMRPMRRRVPLLARLFGNPRTAQDTKQEDENNREKVQQALQAQQTIIETVFPIVNSIAPATTGFLGMLPRMRRSRGSAAEDAPDQLSMPSETTVSVLMPIKQVEQPPESVAPSVVVPINYQQAAMLVAQDRSSAMAEPIHFSMMSPKDEPEMEDKSDDEDETDVEESSSMMSLPQLIPSGMLPHPPDATVTSGDDDKIYFAIDRKTILTFLGALFGNDMRSALAAAVHENSVRNP